MRKKTVVLCVAAVLTVGLLATTPLVLVLTSWANGGERSLDGKKISIQANEYFFPSNSAERVLIGRLFSRRSLIEVARTDMRGDDLSQFVTAECKVLKCTKVTRTKRDVSGNFVEVIEQHYVEDSINHVQARFWTDHNSVVVRFSGPDTEYGLASSSIERKLEEVSKTR